MEPLKSRGSKQHIFFDLGWTLEDETDAQVDRAEKAAQAARAFGVETSAGRVLQRQPAPDRLLCVGCGRR